MGWFTPNTGSRARANVRPDGGGPARRVPWSIVAGLIALAAIAVTFSSSPGDVYATTAPQLKVVSSEPAKGQVLSTAPTEIVLQFDQAVGLAVEDTGSLSCATNLIVIEDGEWQLNRTKLTYAISGNIGRANCVFQYTLEESGAAVATGQIAFSVESAPASSAPGDSTTTTTAAAGGSTPTASTEAGATPTETTVATTEAAAAAPDTGFNPVLWIGRLASTTAILILFGALVVINSGWPEGPEYYVTSKFLRAVWLIGLAGTVIYVVAYAAQVQGGGLAAGLNPVGWMKLLDQGTPGIGALARLAAVAAAGYVALAPERLNDPNSGLWAWILPAIAVVTVALSRVSGPLLAVGVLIGVVHAFGAAVWFGGAVFVGRVVLAGPGEEDLVVATQAYSRSSLLAILVTVATGVMQWIRLDSSDLLGNHGIVVLFKIAVVGVMLFIGLEARKQVRFRLDREYEMSNNNAARFRRAYGTETMFGFIALALSGLLVSISPGTALPWANETYVQTLPIIDAQSGVEAKLSIGPLKVGPNGYLLQVEEPASGISDLRLRFIPPAGTQNGQAWIVEDVIPLTGRGSAWRPASAGIPFGVPGTWTLEFKATTQQGASTGTRMTFVVTAADGSVPAVVVVPSASTTLAPAGAVEVISDDSSTASIASSP